MSTLLTDAVAKTLSQLAAITDAQYPGDTAGTDANAAYFTGNVHNYIKDLAKVLIPSRTLFVSPAYTDIGEPFFDSPEDAYTYANGLGSGSANKITIKLRTCATAYTAAQVFNTSGYVIFKGESRHAVELSGAIAISAGVHIFDGIHLSGAITITGGIVIFHNCTHTGTGLAISGGSTVCIEDCDRWGVITVTGNNNLLYVENVKDIAVDGSSQSIILTAGITGGTYIVRNTILQGVIKEGVAPTEVINVSTGTAKPTTY